MSLPQNKRNRGKNYLLTFPHCDIGLEDMRERILAICDRNGWVVDYMVLSSEKHQDGLLHRHIYILFREVVSIGKRKMRVFDLQADNQSNWEVGHVFHPNIKTLQSPKEGVRYVKKQGEFITFGICPFKEVMSRSEKNKLYLESDLKTLVDEGQVSLLLLDKLKKCKELYQNECTQPSFEKKMVHWFWGDTGSGKTRTAYEEARAKWGESNVWKANGDDKWFDGYNAQPAVIFDDIRAATWRFYFLLQLTDRYPMQVPVKGSFRNWVPNEIWITAPVEPRELYRNYQTGEPYDGIEQLERRIDDLKHFESEEKSTQSNINPWDN